MGIVATKGGKRDTFRVRGLKLPVGVAFDLVSEPNNVPPSVKIIQSENLSFKEKQRSSDQRTNENS